ncbi:MAG TPA: hypothetical protein VLU54_07550, partial [Casimicrobiaceae bacterium]|nr:hypothetical protein [Casimicrobiaceae bacterium]
ALPRSARLAREDGAFGGAVGSTGLLILSVIRAMGQRSAPPAAIASHHSGRAVPHRQPCTGQPFPVGPIECVVAIDATADRSRAGPSGAHPGRVSTG